MRNRTKSATPRVRQFIDDNADETVLPADEPAVETETDTDTVLDEQEDEYDDSWLDGLTPYEPTQAAPETQQVQTPPPQVQEPVSDVGTKEQQDRLNQLYANLEHIDEDVANELHSKLIEPELNSLRAEVAELRQYRQQEQHKRQTAILTDINTKIIAKYPQAERILRSKEFMDHVNSNGNPYSSDTEYEVLMRAYYAGDAEYVISKMDNFASTRGKPRPPVGAEPHQGGRSGVTATPETGKAMSDEEYRRKRRAILSATKGTYPPNALKDLVNEYLNSNSRG